MFSRMLFTVGLLLASILVGEATGQAKSPREEESVLEKCMRLDSSRWFFEQWNHKPLRTKMRTTPDAEKPVSEYVREFVTAEQFKALTDAHAKRIQVHKELSARMYPYDVLERQAAFVRQGRPADMAQRAFPVPRGFVDPTPDECRQALLTYVREQDKAEVEWAAVIDEVLTPDQYVKFLPYFIFNGQAYLHHPFLQNYLGYDDAQKREIEKQLDLYNSLIKKVRRSGGDSLTDARVLQAYYKAYAVLTPEQFQRIAPIVGLKREGESWSDLRARIQGAGGPFNDACGHLIDSIVESFDK